MYSRGQNRTCLHETVREVERDREEEREGQSGVHTLLTMWCICGSCSSEKTIQKSTVQAPKTHFVYFSKAAAA